MSENVTKLKPKQQAAILALLSNRTVEDAARVAKVSPRTLYRWQQEPQFNAAYRKARRASFGQAAARLQQASSAAVSTILKVMVDPGTSASTKLRAADSVLDHGAKALELEDIAARVAALEQATQQSGGRR